WSAAAVRVYSLFGALLTAPLLGVGSLLLSGRRWAAPVGIAYAGLAVGIALAVPLHGTFSGTEIPDTAAHLDFFPARLVAVVGNSLGTLAVVAVALPSIRRPPPGDPPPAARQRADPPRRRGGGRRERALRRRSGLDLRLTRARRGSPL